MRSSGFLLPSLLFGLVAVAFVAGSSSSSNSTPRVSTEAQGDRWKASAWLPADLRESVGMDTTGDGWVVVDSDEDDTLWPSERDAYEGAVAFIEFLTDETFVDPEPPSFGKGLSSTTDGGLSAAVPARTAPLDAVVMFEVYKDPHSGNVTRGYRLALYERDGERLPDAEQPTVDGRPGDIKDWTEQALLAAVQEASSLNDIRVIITEGAGGSTLIVNPYPSIYEDDPAIESPAYIEVTFAWLIATMLEKHGIPVWIQPVQGIDRSLRPFFLLGGGDVE
jgi:hypothetical protein